MSGLTEKGFAKQASIYVKQKEYEKAYEMATEFVAKFPESMVAHYLVAKSAFWLQKQEETAKEARLAFNKATNGAICLPVPYLRPLLI